MSVNHDHLPPKFREMLGIDPTPAPTTAPDFTYEDRLAAFAAGYEQGLAATVEAEAEQRAHELIHDAACDALGMARQHAATKGPAWAALIEDQAVAE